MISAHASIIAGTARRPISQSCGEICTVTLLLATVAVAVAVAAAARPADASSSICPSALNTSQLDGRSSGLWRQHLLISVLSAGGHSGPGGGCAGRATRASPPPGR